MWLYIVSLLLCNCVCVIVLSGGTSRPHPYRKRPTLGNVSNQHIHQQMQQSYNLGYQDSYSPEYPSLHQVTTGFSPFYKYYYWMHVLNNLRHCCRSPLCPTAGLPGYVMRFVLMPSGWSPQEPLAHLYEQQENIDTGVLAGFGQQVQLTVLFQGYVDKKRPVVKFSARAQHLSSGLFVPPALSSARLQ